LATACHLTSAGRHVRCNPGARATPDDRQFYEPYFITQALGSGVRVRGGSHPPAEAAVEPEIGRTSHAVAGVPQE
jgi:hypothetical protein